MFDRRRAVGASFASPPITALCLMTSAGSAWR